MSYTKHEFKSGDKLFATQLNEMDAQIYKNCTDIANHSENISTLNDKVIGLSQLEAPKIVMSLDEMTDTSKHSILDNYIYAYMLKEMGSNISQTCLDTLQAYFIDSINKYDIYAFCPVQFKMKKDSYRMTDKKVQEDISEEILRTLIRYVPEDRYILLMGETPERVNQLLEFKHAKEKLNAQISYW